MNISTIPCGSAKNRRDFIMANATENWVILKTYEKDGRIICVEWRCDRTTDGFTLPFGGESDIDIPSNSTPDEIISAVMADMGPSRLENTRAFNSEMAIRQMRKESATITTY